MAAGKLHAGGVKQRTVIITAKEQVCPCRERGMSASRNMCSSAYCEYARGYYDRVEGALREMLEHYRGYSRGLICEVAKRHRVCPYELSLDLSELCDVVICDYNYAFDPSVYFRRYFGSEGIGGRYVFLVDEAHDLADRAREMYSGELRMSEFEQIIPAVMQDANGTKVLVGPENVAQELKDTSVVVTKFDIGDGMQGMIGVVGPTRMDYAKVTARLSYFAESLSKLFTKPDHPQLPGSTEQQPHKEEQS